jgi:ketosteroid isomerase-like protein
MVRCRCDAAVRGDRCYDVFVHGARADQSGAARATTEPPISDDRRLQLAREAFHAYESGDRGVIERLLSPDFSFYSPADPGIDRARYFERCWPNAARIERVEFVRLIEAGDEVIVTYESTRADGTRFRNTEVLTFAGEQIRRVEVYFGWELP